MGSVQQSITINAPIGQVWQTIRNFHDMSWASKVATSVVSEGEKSGSEIGAKRIINNVFYETLTAFSDQEQTFSYQIDQGPGPLKAEKISSYIGTVKLTADGEQTKVEWSSTFEASDEDAVANFCNPMYSALLAAMKETCS